MEVHPDHSQKSPSYAILSSDPQEIVELPPAHHNLGIDYTAYAHLDNIDPNLKEGTRVAQRFDQRYFRAIW